MWFNRDKCKLWRVSKDNSLHKYMIVARECSAIRAGDKGKITWMGPGTPVMLCNSQLCHGRETGASWPGM